ncbi:MAG: methyltransferase domain-containing protein [Vicinamibacterales bacterium]
MEDRLDLTSLAAETHFWFRGFRAFVSPVLGEAAAGRRGLRLIDCGCGTGHNLQILAPHGRAFGVDLSASGLTHAKAAGRPLVRGDVTHLPYASGAFDIATSFDVLQCVERDRDAVSEMARVLGPGGYAVVTMAALEALRGDHSEVWQEYRRYTPAMARQLFDAAGLRVERVSFLFGTLLPLMYTVRLVQRLTRPYRALSHDSDIGLPPAPINAALTWLVEGEAALARRLPRFAQTPAGSSLLVVARKAK